MGYNNFEDSFLNNTDRKFKKEKEDNLFDESLLLKLKKRFEDRYGNSRPNMDDFSSVYLKDEIQKDKEILKSVEKDFDTDSKDIVGETIERYCFNLNRKI
jgi:hypothetical protein